VQTVDALGVCEYEQRLMNAWHGAVSDFSRVVAMLAGCDVQSAEYSLLKAQAETARLHFDNAPAMWQRHCESDGCRTEPGLRSDNNGV
jgi:hypothetical protein